MEFLQTYLVCHGNSCKYTKSLIFNKSNYEFPLILIVEKCHSSFIVKMIYLFLDKIFVKSLFFAILKIMNVLYCFVLIIIAQEIFFIVLIAQLTLKNFTLSALMQSTIKAFNQFISLSFLYITSCYYFGLYERLEQWSFIND